MTEIEILSKKDAISVVKENKTQVDYFIFDEYEIHHCTIPPFSSQEWHKHNVIEEVIDVTKGSICVKWKENNEIHSQSVKEGCILRVKKLLHTIENCTDKSSDFIVFRMVPTGKDKRQIIKNDKVRINELEI